MEITAENLIPKNRLNKFLIKALIKLEKSDPSIAKKLEVIRARAKGKQIQFSQGGKLAFGVRASATVIADLEKAIDLLYLQDTGSRITEETLTKMEEMIP